MNLFAYGTLMFPDIWERVAGQPPKSMLLKTTPPKSAPAALARFAIRRAAGDLFPVIFPNEDEAVAGLLYFDVSKEVFTKLDVYESEIYQRENATVTLEDGGNQSCEIYVLRQRLQRLASEASWTAEWFEQHAKAEYMRRFRS